ARVALVLVEAAHVPAVVELDHPPFVAIATRTPILVHGKIVWSPLAIDPADGAGDVLLVIAPREASPHVETALEVREGAGPPEDHPPPAGERAAQGSGGPARLDRQLERHARSMVIDTRKHDLPRERNEFASSVAELLPARRSRRAVEAEGEVARARLDLVPTTNARWSREVVVGVRTIVTTVEIVQRERVEPDPQAFSQDAHVGEDHDERERPPALAPTQEPVDEVRRHPEIAPVAVDCRKREPIGIAPVGHVWVALPVRVVHADALSSD